MNELEMSVTLMYSRSDDATTSGASGWAGASGIMINDDWIVSHGSLLDPIVAGRPELRRFIHDMEAGRLTSLGEFDMDDLELRVFRRQDRRGESLSEEESPRDVSPMEIRKSHVVQESKGHIVTAWKCPLLEKTFRELSFGWKFHEKRNVDERLMPIFLMIEITRNAEARGDRSGRAREVLIEFAESEDSDLREAERGSTIEITSTPFGNLVFVDSLSRGVTSNLLGDSTCVIMTDANTVPGAEGAPVYVTSPDGTRRNLCGMVIAPLSWCRGEWVDYTFAASLLPCFRRLISNGRNDELQLHQHDHQQQQQQHVDDSNTKIYDILKESLVMITCGAGWGSGTIVDVTTGTIVTCAHVVHGAPDSPIKVVLRRDDDTKFSGPSRDSSIRAKLVYRTSPGRAYDVAVIAIDPRAVPTAARSIALADPGSIVRGETVASAGFPFWSSRSATITRGNVSSKSECMIQTTCCIQSGSSGGPVVRWSTGEMLGMIVCNAIAAKNEKIYPRLNLAIPIDILKNPIEEYIRTNDIKVLQVLDEDDPGVQEMWNFKLLPSSKI